MAEVRVFYSDGSGNALSQDPSIAQGWYYQVDDAAPRGPFDNKRDALDRLAAECTVPVSSLLIDTTDMARRMREISAEDGADDEEGPIEGKRYRAAVGFYLHAYDYIEFTAENDAAAIIAAKERAEAVMQRKEHPDGLDTDERHAGVIGYLDRYTPDGPADREEVASDIEFDTERVEIIDNDRPAAHCFSDRELAAVLAGLRYWQWKRDGLAVDEKTQDILTIETNGGALDILSDDEIDALCERLNIHPKE